MSSALQITAASALLSLLSTIKAVPDKLPWLGMVTAFNWSKKLHWMLQLGDILGRRGLHQGFTSPASWMLTVSLSHLWIGRNFPLWQSPVAPGLDSPECIVLLRGWFCLRGCSLQAPQQHRGKKPFPGQWETHAKNNHLLLSAFSAAA